MYGWFLRGVTLRTNCGNAKPAQTNQGMSMFKVALSLMSNMNQSACSTLDWVLNIQSELTKYCVSIIGYPINKKIIPMSTCPIVCCLSQKWRKWRIKQIDEDIKYCHPRWPEEKLFLENEKEQLDQFKSNYFQDFWFVSTMLWSVNASMYFKTRCTFVIWKSSIPIKWIFTKL